MSNLSQNSSQFELENQFILRLPTVKDEHGNVQAHPSAVKLREALSKVNLTDSSVATNTTTVESGADQLKDRLFIELNSESRKGRIKFDSEMFEARLVDLPCIVESLKTVDRKTFFKTNDICQMLICKTKEDPWSSSGEEGDGSKGKKDKKRQSESGAQLNAPPAPSSTAVNAKKYQWPHGIAPPLKNVRRKRFRKVAKKKIIDYVEIEKEVKQLFRADREAVKIDYEVVLVDGELEDENNMDDENKLNNGDDDFENSSQEEENNAMMMGAECSNTATGYLDSITDNLTSQHNTAAGNLKLKKINKSSSNQIEESNMSSVMDDDDSSIIAKKRNPPTDTEDNNEDGDATNMNPTNFDELSNDNSNFVSNKATTKRTGFKNLFVEQVIGDLSSSEDDDGDDDEDEEEETKNKKATTSSSFKFNLNKNSVHTSTASAANAKDSENDEGKLDASTNLHARAAATLGDESVSNFDDFGAEELSNLDSKQMKSTETKNKSKPQDLLDASNSSSNNDDNDTDDDDLDDEENKTKDISKNFPSSLSSSPATSVKSHTESSKTDKSELESKLSNLMDELNKIKEERRKREIEINQINNPVLKAHLSSRLKNLIEDENKKTIEIENLKSLLNE